MKLDLYIYSESVNYNSNLSGENLDDCAERFMVVTDLAKENDESIYIADSFYEQEISQGSQVFEWLWDEISEDQIEGQTARKLLSSLVRDVVTLEGDEYQEIITSLKSGEPSNSGAAIGVFDCSDDFPHVPFVKCEASYRDVHRFYLKKVDSIDEFLTSFEICFPDIYFHERVSQTIKILKPFRRHRGEIIRHLIVLNDEARKMYEEHGVTNNAVYNHLKSNFAILASGQGDPGFTKKHLEFVFTTVDGLEKELSCSPHTKLYYNHSDYRIYFNWGDTFDFSDGKRRILVGHIGHHPRD